MSKRNNVTYPLGSIVLLESIEKDFGFFDRVFGDFGGWKDFSPQLKLLVANRLTHSVSINKILDVYPTEFLQELGLEEIPSKRSLNRTVERVGRNLAVFHERFQEILAKNDLIDKTQFIDFSSSYTEGKKTDLATYGYSRDGRPDRPQVNFGISTGINGIPAALTIQKGNVDDKTHFREILKVVQHVIEKESLLIFDAGANTRKNKENILSLGYNYLTLKPKHKKSYMRLIDVFRRKKAGEFCINERKYSCVKIEEGSAFLYIFFCPDLKETHLWMRKAKFEREKKRGNSILHQRKQERLPSEKGWVGLVPFLEPVFDEIENPYITGLEGFFVLESSIDAEPEKLLRLYKKKDKAEKFIRALKEGVDIRPFRHWNPDAVRGIIFISFIANFLVNLTEFLARKNFEERASCGLKAADKGKSPLLTNVKLLKKFLMNLTMTVVYPKDGFKFRILANVTEQILLLFGDFVWRWEDKTLKLRW